MDEDKDSSDDEASSDDEKESKKNKKKDKSDEKEKTKKEKEKEKEKEKDKKKKKSKKKAKKSESSDDSESSSSDSEEESKSKEKKTKSNGKTKEPEISKPTVPTQGKLAKINVIPKQNKAKQETTQSTKKQEKVDNSNILDMDFGFDNSAAQKVQDSNQEWTEFGTSTTQKSADSSNELFNAFESNTNSGKTDDLIKSLGDLYSQTPQPQYQQFPQYPQSYPTGYSQTYPQTYPQAPMPSTGFPPAYGYQGFPSQYAAPPKPVVTPQPSYDDPFASIIEEQQKKQNAELQKAQAAKLMQQTTPTAPVGITPNILFQQMMAFMQSASGQQPNVSQNAMMMAAMQNMMAQMTMNSQAAAQKQEPKETLLEEPAPDPNKAMFKSLFNDATSTAFSQPKPSDFGFKAQYSSSTAAPAASSYSPFSAPTPAPVTRHSEPTNPFGSFGTSTGAASTTQSSGLFDTQFSNSGFKSGGK